MDGLSGIHKFLQIKTLNKKETMAFFIRCLIGFIIGISVFIGSPGMAADQNKEITENACARFQNSEIVWDLSKYHWMCCIIKNEDEYET